MKPMKNSIFIFSLVILFFVSSCQDDQAIHAITSEGVLAWYGDPAVDGCGLVLEVDSIWYRTSARKNSFLHFTEADSNRIDVIATYRIRGEAINSWGCRITPAEIIKIKRRNSR